MVSFTTPKTFTKTEFKKLSLLMFTFLYGINAKVKQEVYSLITAMAAMG